MQKWEHKVDWWLGPWFSGDGSKHGGFLGYQLMLLSGKFVDTEKSCIKKSVAVPDLDGEELEVWMKNRTEEIQNWKDEGYSFEQWLDWYSSEGWEVLRVFDWQIKKFQRKNNHIVDRPTIQVIFRRLVD